MSKSCQHEPSMFGNYSPWITIKSGDSTNTVVSTNQFVKMGNFDANNLRGIYITKCGQRILCLLKTGHNDGSLILFSENHLRMNKKFESLQEQMTVAFSPRKFIVSATEDFCVTVGTDHTSTPKRTVICLISLNLCTTGTPPFSVMSTEYVSGDCEGQHMKAYTLVKFLALQDSTLVIAKNWDILIYRTDGVLKALKFVCLAQNILTPERNFISSVNFNANGDIIILTSNFKLFEYSLVKEKLEITTFSEDDDEERYLLSKRYSLFVRKPLPNTFVTHYFIISLSDGMIFVLVQEGDAPIKLWKTWNISEAIGEYDYFGYSVSSVDFHSSHCYFLLRKLGANVSPISAYRFNMLGPQEGTIEFQFKDIELTKPQLLLNTRYQGIGEVLVVDKKMTIVGHKIPYDSFSLKSFSKRAILTIYDQEQIMTLPMPRTLKDYVLM